MNIKQLKEQIKDLPDDMEIILSSDAEGNHYSPLVKLENDCKYLLNNGDIMNSFSGDVYRIEEIHEYVGFTEGMKNYLLQFPDVCVLTPVC